MMRCWSNWNALFAMNSCYRLSIFVQPVILKHKPTNNKSKNIFGFFVGHSICSDCKTQIHVCPTCRSQISGSIGRNYTLEKLTQKVKYPCRNREIGCGFVTTSDKIRQHQRSCELSENPCILK